MTLIGAHVSSAGGCSRAFERGTSIGAEAIQLFLSAPQRWKGPAISDDERVRFRRAKDKTGLPVFAHAAYLVNLASPDDALVARSTALLGEQLALCGELGIEGLVFHLGSHLGAGFETVLPQVSGVLRDLSENTSGGARLIIENNAGQGGGVGTTFAEIGALVDAAGGHPRLALCLDTCHAFACGYDLTGPVGVEAAMAELAERIGEDRLVVIHANDSKTPLGGLRDRHENIGDGHLGLDSFAALMSHPLVARVPFVMEVPGVDGGGPDRENVLRLKAIRAGIEASAARS